MATKNAESKHEPGFYKLGLRICQALDTKQIEYLIGEQDEELKCCHTVVEIAVKSLKAFLLFQIPKKKTQAIKILEQIIEQFPNNLNVLENLADMYDERREQTKANQCRTNVEGILKSTDTRIEVARSMAEQGYIMMVDLHSETRNSPERQMLDFRNQIQEKLKCSKSAIETKRCESILSHVREIQKQLLGSESDCHRETTQERKLAMEKLRRAIKIFEEENERRQDQLREEIIVWKHYLGKAYLRLSGGSDEITSGIERKSFIEKAIKNLTKVVCSLNTETDANVKNAILVARSYAYIANMYVQKSHILKIEELKIGDNGVTVEILISRADDLCKKAPDRVTLNRLGIIYVLKSEWQKAEHFFNRSIDCCKDYNWYVYSWLCRLYLSKHVEKFKEEKVVPTESEDLKKAKKYGIQCLEMRQTSVSLYRLAKVCKFMGEYHEAIEYLQTALSSHECEKHYNLYALLANCWHEVEKYEEAVHLMKIAITIEPKNQKDPIIFRDFLEYLIKRFRKDVKENKGNPWPRKSKSLTEICCVLEEGYRKHKKRIKFQLIGVINKYPHETVEVVDTLLKQTRTERLTQLIDMCLKALEHHKGRHVLERTQTLREKWQRTPTETTETENNLDEEQSFADTPPISTDFPYDFYVLFCPSQKSWVENIFLDVVENDYVATGPMLKGLKCKNTDTVTDISMKCRRFVFVISKDFKATPRVKTLAQEIKKRYINEDGKIIPILRDIEEKDYPDFLNIVESCDADDIFKIKNAILGFTQGKGTADDDKEDEEDGKAENKEDIKEENKEDNKEENTEDSKGDNKGDSKEENKEDRKRENREDSQEEQKEDNKKEHKEDSEEECKEESRDDDN